MTDQTTSPLDELRARMLHAASASDRCQFGASLRDVIEVITDRWRVERRGVWIFDRDSATRGIVLSSDLPWRPMTEQERVGWNVGGWCPVGVTGEVTGETDPVEWCLLTAAEHADLIAQIAGCSGPHPRGVVPDD